MGFMKGPLASEGRAGMIQLASAEEAAAGLDNTKAVTPATLAAVVEDAVSGGMGNVLGVSFDGINAAGTRLYAAEGKTFSASTDAAAGTDDFKNLPVYAGYYALVKYNPTSQKAEIIAYEGTPEYDAYIAAGTEDFDVVRMFPKFYYKHTINADGSTEILLSPTEKTGFKPSPMHYRYNATTQKWVMHDWIGITRYAWGYDANATGGMASKKGLYPLTNTSEATFYTKAVSRGLRVFGAREFSALQMLGCVKYANQNWQSAVAAGYTDANVSVALTADTTGTQTATFAYSEENAKLFVVGRYISFVDDRRYSNVHKITDVAIDGTTSITVTFDGSAAPEITVGTTKIYLGLAHAGTADNVKGLDGRNTAMSTNNGRMSANFLGIENLFGNVTKACSGIVRYDGSMWIKDDTDNDNTWLTTSDQSGWKRACASYDNSAGYIKRFHPTTNMGEFDWLSSPIETGGDSSKPVGDYVYSNTTKNSVYMCGWGGLLWNGAISGPFYASLVLAVSSAAWAWGALGVYIPE